ncbi:MAG: VWA domain-containing protein [Vallitalea sp.]|jgi:Mg-chelatase subunit ChlD|nr:VWA domain-containing protein [Vallitalea sp.]
MRIEFGRAWVLFLYPIILLFLIIISKQYYVTKLKKYMLITIRAIVLLFLVLALSDISFVMTSKDTTTIFLSDVSESAFHEKEEIKEFIKEAIKTKNKNDSIASIVFGKEASLDVNISKDITSDLLESDINKSYTDIEQGLLKSLALLPTDSNKRIVIITDGKENKGKASKLIQSIKDQEIEIKVKSLDTRISEEVYIDKFYIPQKVNLGEQFQVNMDIYSTEDTMSKITLIADGEKVITDNIQLRKGTNNYVLNDIAKKKGFVNYELLIEPANDTLTVNNTYSAFTLVESSPKVLLIYDDKKDVTQMEKIATSIGLNYDKLNSLQVPTDIKNILKYKSVILCNVSAENLSQGFLENIEIYVKEFGGGLVAIGGESSYALGGYYKTPLETVLPVNIKMRGKQDKPNIAMVLVIDKSGSMSGQKLRLAKEAATRTVEVLEDNDEIGVIAFDNKPYDIVDLQKAKSREDIIGSVLNINEGGGTSILPALEKAYKKLDKSNAEFKHIILLTDGQAESTGYDKLINNMNYKKITLSTVGIGDGADNTLLKYIASSGKGRNYLTKDGRNIPRIFAKETFMATRTYLNNITFVPNIVSYHSILSDIYNDGLPELDGYIGTSPKEAATVLLTSPTYDPILSVWQYGLGKTVAWCSDLSGEWSSKYNIWDKNNLLWQNIINYTIENYSSNQVEINSIYSNGEVHIRLNTLENDKLLDSSVQIKTPSNKINTIDLEAVRKGVYEGIFIPNEVGSYMIKGIQKYQDEVVGTGLSGITIPYSEEYKITNKNDDFAVFIKKVDGKYIDKPDEVFKDILNNVKKSNNITNILLLIALILWMIDIAFRRFNIIAKFHKLLIPIENTNILFKNIKLGYKSKKLNTVEKIQQNVNVEEKRKSNKELNKKLNSTNEEEKILDTKQLLGNIKKKQ